MKATKFLIWTAVAFAIASSACTSQQGYGAAQAWQRNECQKLADQEQRSRCLKSIAKTYDEYRHQADELGSKK